MSVTIYTFYNTGDFDFILNFTSQFKERLNIGLDQNQWILLAGKSNVCKKKSFCEGINYREKFRYCPPRLKYLVQVNCHFYVGLALAKGCGQRNSAHSK